MEMQRHAQLMYTSCGWFFDDISGIETVQVIAYAARAIQLAAEVIRASIARNWKRIFSRFSARRKSNVPEWKNGAEIYKRLVKPLEVTLEQVAAHYAISSFFSNYSEETTLFCYTVRRLDYDVVASGHGRLAMGRVRGYLQHHRGERDCFALPRFTSAIRTSPRRSRALRPRTSPAFKALKKKCGAAVTLGNLPEVVRLIDGYFGGSPYSLVSLFSDDQRRILRVILQSTLGEVERSLASIYEEHASLLHFLSAAKLPKPPALNMAAGFAINAGLRRALRRRSDRSGADALPDHAGQGRRSLSRPVRSQLSGRSTYEARHGQPASRTRWISTCWNEPSPWPARCASFPSGSISGRRKTSGMTC